MKIILGDTLIINKIFKKYDTNNIIPDKNMSLIKWKNLHNFLTDIIKLQRKKVKNEIIRINDNKNPYMLNSNQIYEECHGNEKFNLSYSF